MSINSDDVHDHIIIFTRDFNHQNLSKTICIRDLFKTYVMDILERRLGVGWKFRHLMLSLLIGGISALLATSLPALRPLNLSLGGASRWLRVMDRRLVC